MSDAPHDQPGHLAKLCWEVFQLDQMRRWQLGQRPPAEDYLHSLPDLSSDAAGALNQIYNEILLRRRLGETPTIEEYLQRFPHFAAELRDQFEFDRVLGTQLSAESASQVLTRSAAPAAEGQPHLPGYQILARLGQGGMGVVYKARPEKWDRIVAVKMIRSGELASPEEQRRFQTEIAAVARVQHPAIVQIHHVDQVGSQPYFVMEYLAGGSLADYLQGRPQPHDQAARLVARLALGVAAAHEVGVIHRDLKPANILLAATPDGSLADVEAKIADFGLAKHLNSDSKLTRTDALLGSPSYMSPEQAAGAHAAVGPQSDIHALGALLYEMLTGRPPFAGSSVTATLQQVREQEPVPPRRLQPNVPRDLETICLKCLHKEPQRRYASAAELADDLRRFVAGEPIRARPVGRLETAWRWCRRKPALAALMATVVLTLLLGTAVSTWFGVRATRAAEAAEASERAERTARTQAERDGYFHSIVAAEFGWRDGHIAEVQRLLDACPTELRQWEWSYLQKLCNGQEVVCRSTGVALSDVVLSPDGTRLAATGTDNGVWLWDTTGQHLRTISGEPQQSLGLAFRRDGCLLACVGSADGRVRIREVETGRDLLAQPGHEALVNRMAFHLDSQQCATGCEAGGIRLWNLRDGSSRRLQHGPRIALLALAFSPDGRRLASASLDSTVIVWEVASGRELCTFRGHHYAATSVAFSPDGQWLASGSRTRDSRARQELAELLVWNPTTGEVKRLEGQPQDITQVAFFNNGAALVTAGLDRTIRIWDIASGKGSIRVRGHQPFTSVCVAPSGRLASSSADGTVRLWDLSREQRCQLLRGDHPNTPSSVAFAADGRRLLAGYLGGSLRLWDLETRRACVVADSHEKEVVHGVAMHPNCGLAASGGRDRKVRLWDTRTMRQQGEPLPHDDYVQTVAFSPNGDWLASGCRDGRMRIWDVVRGQCRAVWRGHTGLIHSVAFSSDGQRLASCGEDGTVRLWAVADASPLGELKGQHAENTCLSWSRDDRFLVVGGGTRDPVAHVWDVPAGKIVTTCRGHEVQINAVALTPDGKRLATGSADGTVRLWEVQTGREILSWHDHKDAVTCVAFRPDGGQLISGGWDRTLMVWDTLPP